ncbi:MAG: glycosyltransferase, partial [Gemmatimonadales bacterium]
MTSVLAGHWARQRHRVSLITLGPAAGDAYPLAPGVERHGLDLLGPSGNPLRATLNNIRRWRALRRRVRSLRPDAVISFVAETNVLTLAACG